MCERLNIETNAVIEDEFKHEATQTHSSEPTKITSKCNASVASSHVYTEKYLRTKAMNQFIHLKSLIPMIKK